ncbi:maltase 1-like protein [Dinothrombium tinctorium]|uniref:alpha-glucosidase n=1 Tax=Dinothrombium tinctorium TaxID=1965070 RepID=A0A3S3PRS6_9ACAR|nr:maltase 1-like protein [Dinothrombium tinctorium]RWS06968.1 maltase 1-like protein [Dinothrombium tinctorium]
MSKEDVTLDVDSDKMVKEPLTLKDGESPSKVQFVNADGKNGEVNIITPPSPKKAGLSKEELMKYANDPFWVRLRLALFVLFWIVWISMLVGAIVIIIVAPKCPPSSKLKWYQKTSAYEIDVKSFVNGLLSKFDYFSDLDIETIVLRSFLGERFTEINPKIGTFDEFDKFIEKATQKNKKVILSFDFRYTSTSHEWFNKSVNLDSDYIDYYLWKNASTNGKQKNWIRNEARNNSDSYYYVPDIGGIANQDFAVLNITNPRVKNEIREVIKFWKSKKVNGFIIENADELIPSELFEDAQNKNIEFLQSLRKYIYTKVDVTGKTGFFIDVANDSATNTYVGAPTDKISDLVISDFFRKANKTTNGKGVKEIIKNYYDSFSHWPKDSTKYGPWTGCRLSRSDKSLKSQVGEDHLSIFLMLFYMLPNCTHILTAGDEFEIDNIPNWSANETNWSTNVSQAILLKELTKMRRSNIDSLLMGETKYPIDNDDQANSDLFSIARVYPGFKGLLLIANFGEEKSIKLENANYLSGEGEVIIVSEKEKPMPKLGKVDLKAELKIGRKQAVMIQYGPIE